MVSEREASGVELGGRSLECEPWGSVLGAETVYSLAGISI
jgi:hypothetical protein